MDDAHHHHAWGGCTSGAVLHGPNALHFGVQSLSSCFAHDRLCVTSYQRLSPTLSLRKFISLEKEKRRKVFILFFGSHATKPCCLVRMEKKKCRPAEPCCRALDVRLCWRQLARVARVAADAADAAVRKHAKHAGIAVVLCAACSLK